MTIGTKFTQADLNLGAIDYTDINLVEGDDHFLFTVEDGEGGWFGIERFPIRTSTSVSTKNLDPLAIGLDVFPNPSSGDLYLRLSDRTLETNQIQLVNWLGQIVPVGATITGSGLVRLDLGQTTNGMYLVRVNLPEGVAVAKVQIIR